MPQYKLLLAGCGQLGSRHLQAAASLEQIDEIDVLDSSLQAIDLGKNRIREVDNLNNKIGIQWHTDIKMIRNGGDMCIVATQAKGRVELIKRIFLELGYKKFIIEKIVSQSIEEYEDLMDFCRKNNISIWVNCKTRAYAVNKYFKNKLASGDPIIFINSGGNHGLANNGIHTADLFAYFDGARKINRGGVRIDDILHTSKRGKDIFDLSGTVSGFTDKGSDFMLSFSGKHNAPDCIQVVSANYRFIIDHFQKLAYESFPSNDWQWQRLKIEEDWMVSKMSKIFIADILEKQKCDLPDVYECFPAHEFILGQLLAHFNKITKSQNKYCPVT